MLNALYVFFGIIFQMIFVMMIMSDFIVPEEDMDNGYISLWTADSAFSQFWIHFVLIDRG